MANDTRLSKADRKAYNEHYASKGIEDAVCAADTLQDDMIGIKRQKEEKAAKEMQRAAERYKAIQAARQKEDEDFMSEFGMTIDEAKRRFKMSKGELRDWTTANIPENDKGEDATRVQTTTKKVTTRTDGELPETTTSEVSTIYDEPEDRKAPHFRVKETDGELNEEYDGPIDSYTSGDETQTPFEGLKSNWDAFADSLTKMSNMIPYGKRDEFLSLGSDGKANMILKQSGISPEDLIKMLKKSNTTRNLINHIRDRYW